MKKEIQQDNQKINPRNKNKISEAIKNKQPII